MYPIPFVNKDLHFLDGLKVNTKSEETNVELLVIFIKKCEGAYFTVKDKDSISESCPSDHVDKVIKLCEKSKFNGAWKESMMNHCCNKSILLVGLGTDLTKPDLLKSVVREIAPKINSLNAKTVSLQYNKELPDCFTSNLVQEFFVYLQVDDRLKSVKKDLPAITELYISGNMDIEDVKLRARIVQLSKMMINSPPNYCFPENLSAMMKDDAKRLGIEIKVYGYEECKAMGMGAFCAVAQGMKTCDRDSQLVHMVYKNGTPKKRICLVGKGVTHDTGGYNVKSFGTMMHLMHTDMGGSAIHYGTFKYICEKKWKDVEIHCMLGFVENLIDSTAVIPGDVVTTMNGITVEVMNTDAEGRLVMCDMVNLYEKIIAEKNDGLEALTITCCTLTGAQLAAFGQEIGNYFTDHEDMAEAMAEAHKTTVDNYWRMPIHHPYNRYIEGTRSDIINAAKGVPMPGACNSIIGCLYMNKFIKKSKFMHCDVAGPVFDGEATGYGCSGMIACLKKLTNN